MNMLKITSRRQIPKNFTGIVEYEDGNKVFLKEGKYHRTDGPAIEWLNGTKLWYIEDKRHRIDGPAIEWSDGSKEWWIDDNIFNCTLLDELIQTSVYLGKEKSKFNLEWLRFLTEDEIYEFPIIPGMWQYEELKISFESLDKETKTAPIP